MLDPDEYDPGELRRLAASDGTGDGDEDGGGGDPAGRAAGVDAVSDVGGPDDDSTQHPDDVASGRQTRRLALLARQTSPNGRPYLRRLPAGLRGEALALAWVEYLVDRVGAGGAEAALAHYGRIGWLGDDAVEGLTRHVSAVAGDGDATVPAADELPAGLTPADGAGRDAGRVGVNVAGDRDGPGHLRPADHRLGLCYVAQLGALADQNQR